MIMHLSMRDSASVFVWTSKCFWLKKAVTHKAPQEQTMSEDEGGAQEQTKQCNPNSLYCLSAL